jgi:hypothetical protein
MIQIERTHSDKVEGLLAVTIATGILLYKSQWFAVMPLPDDIYEITVREENRELLDGILNRKKAGND